MSDLFLFEAQKDVTEDDCVQYARKFTKSSVDPVPWQGYHSYTLLAKSGVIVQFRSQASPFDTTITTLAKKIHGDIAPTTTYEGLMPNSAVSIWVMEALPGVGYLFTWENTTAAKQDVTVIDLARFFAASWNNVQSPDSGKYDLYHAKLVELSGALPKRFTSVIRETEQNLNEILSHARWVLTHPDLSNMNILVDPDTGHLTGVVDWADASIEPFGVGLWGLESVLGVGGPKGWSYFGGDASHYRELFRETILNEIVVADPAETQKAVNKVRTLGILLQYGFRWEDGLKPASDTSILEIILGSNFRRLAHS